MNNLLKETGNAGKTCTDRVMTANRNKQPERYAKNHSY